MKEPSILNAFGELALYSFAKIMISVKCSSNLQMYRQDHRLLEGIPDFDIKMGYGLHVGWAIEVNGIISSKCRGPLGRSIRSTPAI